MTQDNVIIFKEDNKKIQLWDWLDVELSQKDFIFFSGKRVKF